MTKRKRPKQHPPTPRRKRDLDHAPETADTTASESKGAGQSAKYERQQDVDPQFQPPSKFLDFHKAMAVIAYVGAVLSILVIVAGIVWYFAIQHSTVKNLADDVEEIQEKTNRLLESTARIDSRLESVDDSVSEIRIEMRELRRQAPPEDEEE